MKFPRIYVEEAARAHPRTQAILEKQSAAEIIECERYGEVFNPKRQNFRLQKAQPSLILAIKRGQRVLPTPPEYGLGADHHFYFSHMLNCLYDCRYCFLQGMYSSANYVHFVNDADFMDDIDATLEAHPGESCFFFSGYDCDSLAMEALTGFAKAFLPFFADRPLAYLELRTKSVNTKPLLEQEAQENVVVAFSLNPEKVAQSIEHGAPALAARLKAMKKLADAGWPIGLRFDPMLYFQGWQEAYEELFATVFATLPEASIHSVTYGSFRSPKAVFKNMKSLYPEEPLFRGSLSLSKGNFGYYESIEEEISSFAEAQLSQYVESSKRFPCREAV